MAQYAKENAINIASFNSTIRSVQHGKRVRRFKKKKLLEMYRYQHQDLDSD